jgi:hypothetical protein
MNDSISTLLSWHFLLFCLSIYAIIFVFRTIIEYFFPHFTEGHLWNNLILLVLPPVVGGVLAYYATQYAYPSQLSNLTNRLMFGGTAGLFSSFIYRVLKAQLKSTIQGYLTGILPTGMAPTSASTTVNYTPPPPLPLPTPPASPSASTTTTTESTTVNTTTQVPPSSGTGNTQ